MEHFFFWCSNLGALGFAGFVIFFLIMFSKQTVSCSFCFPLFPLLLLLFQYVYCLGTLYNSPYIDFFISHRIILKNGKKNSYMTQQQTPIESLSTKCFDQYISKAALNITRKTLTEMSKSFIIYLYSSRERF